MTEEIHTPDGWQPLIPSLTALSDESLTALRMSMTGDFDPEAHDIPADERVFVTTVRKNMTTGIAAYVNTVYILREMDL